MTGETGERAAALSQELLGRAQNAFKETFGRTFRKGERIILAELRYSEEDMRREHRKAFDLAGSPRHLVYATEKTGRFVSSKNWHLLSPAEQDEWTAAVEEYLASEAMGIDLLNKPDTRINRALSSVRKSLDDAVVHLGSYALRAPRAASKDFSIFCRHLLIVKCYWHFKRLADKWDALSTIEICAINRSLYECTLLIGMLIRNPDYAETLQAQAFGGESPFPYRKKRDGSTDYLTIVSSENGNYFPARTSFRACALAAGEEHVNLFDVLYPMMSDQVHFDLRTMIERYYISGSFLMWDDGNEMLASVLSCATAIYLLGWLLFALGLQKLVKRDVGFIGQRLASDLDELLEALEEANLRNTLLANALERLGKIRWGG